MDAPELGGLLKVAGAVGLVDRGVVDQAVEVRGEAGEFVGDVVNRGREVEEVGLDGEAAPAGFGDVVAEGLDLMAGRAEGEGDVEAALGQVQCDGPADAAGSSGDQGHGLIHCGRAYFAAGAEQTGVVAGADVLPLTLG